MHQHSKYSFRIIYAVSCIGLLLAEITIAIFLHDRWIRPFIGDLLVVLLLYTFLRIFVRWKHWHTASICLIFAYCVEFAQFFHLSSYLDLGRVGSIVLGSTFDPIDLLAYGIGFLLCGLFDPWKNSSSLPTNTSPPECK